METERSIESDGSEQRGIDHAAFRAVTATTVIDGLGRLLAWIVATLRRNRSFTGKHKQMQLVESLALGNRRQLLLVVCEGQRYLVGAGADSVGSILVIAGGTLPVEELRPVAGIPAGVSNCLGKRPELVRQRVRQIFPEPKPGADRWQ